MEVSTTISKPRQSASRACPVLGCTNAKAAQRVMCVDCWQHVPETIRAVFNNLFSDHRTRYSREIHDVMNRAIESVPPIKQPAGRKR